MDEKYRIGTNVRYTDIKNLLVRIKFQHESVSGERQNPVRRFSRKGLSFHVVLSMYNQELMEEYEDYYGIEAPRVFISADSSDVMSSTDSGIFTLDSLQNEFRKARSLMSSLCDTLSNWGDTQGYVVRERDGVKEYSEL